MTISEESTVIKTTVIAPYELIEDYDPKDEAKISEAIFLIDGKLLKAKNIENISKKDIETTYLICSLAMNNIHQLSKELQESLDKVKGAMHAQLLDQEYQKFLSKNDELKSIQIRLYEIFDKGHSKERTSLQKHIEIEEQSNQQISLTHTGLHSPFPSASDTSSGKKKQIKHVKDFGNRFMRDYYPVIILGRGSSPSDVFLQYTLKEFFKTFPSTIPHFLFHAPKIAEQHEKDVIISVLEQITTFFHVYNQAVEPIKKIEKNFEEIKLIDKETLILSRMRSILHEMTNGDIKENSLIPSDLDESKMMVNLSKIFKTLITQYYQLSDPNFEQTPRETQQFIASMIPSFIIPLVFEHIFSPKVFRILFMNLLLRDINIPDDCVDATPFKECDASDLAFTKQVGKIGQQLIHEILKFGEAKGILKGVKLIAGKDSIGELIQKGINHILGTDSCFIPVTILDHLLYNNGRPTLLEAFSSTSITDTSNMEEDVKKRIYEILIEKLPSMLAWMTDSFTSVDTFCETLSKRIFELTQSRKLFILFSCYFLIGFKEGLSKPASKEK